MISKQQYLKLKKLLNQLIKQAEKEALEEGIDITSQEFEELVLALKIKILEEKGFTLTDYQEAGKLVKETKIKESQRPSVLIPREQVEEMLSEFRAELEVLTEKLRVEEDKTISYEEVKETPDIAKIAETIAYKKVEEHHKKAPHLSEKEIRKITKSEIPKIPEDISDKVNELEQDILEIQKNGVDLLEKIENLNVVELKNTSKLQGLKDELFEEIESNPNWGIITSFGEASIRLQSQIDEVKGLITSESIWNRTGTTISPQTAGDNLDMGAGYIEQTEISTPSTPAANKGDTYVKDDGFGESALFFLSDAGNETQLGAGGGGGATTLPALNDVDDSLFYIDRYVFIADGSKYTGRALVTADLPAIGSDTQVLYMAGSSPAGDAGFTYNETTNVLSIVGGIITPSMITNDAASPTAIAITSGSATSGNSAGANLTIQTGNGFGTGGGGSLSVFGGTAGATGVGGGVTLGAGQGGATSGAGGGLQLEAGSAQAGNSDGGDFQLTVGLATGSGIHGRFIFQPMGNTVGTGILNFDNLTAERIFTLPNQAGTIALSENTVNLTGDQTVNGIKTFGSIPVLPGSNPTADNQAVRKLYVDNLVGTGQRFVGAVNAATTAALAANTYDNGASGVGATLTGNANGSIGTIDGVAAAVDNEYLIQDEVTGANNGEYTLTQVGDAGLPYILTRTTRYDTSAEIITGTFFNVLAGTVNGNKLFSMTTAGTITVGTTAIVFDQLGALTAYTASGGVELFGADFRLDLLANGGLEITGNEVGVNIDDSSIGLDGSGNLQVKALGITNAMLAGSIADSKLSTITTASKVDSTAITGIGALVQGDLIYGSGTDALALLVKDATATRYLSNTGASNNPAWAQVNLANGVTGDLPYANLTASGSASKLLGRGDSGAGDWQEITIGTGLAMSGTTISATGGGGSGTAGEVMVVLGSDVTRTVNTLADATGLSFAAAANTDYTFEFNIIFRSSTGASGIAFAVNGPAGFTTSVLQRFIPTSLTAITSGSARAYNSGVNSASIDTANVDTFAQVKGILRNGATSGTFILRFRPETNGVTATVKAGSVLVYRQITAGSGSIIGTDTQVLYFDGANNPAGDAGMTYNDATDTLTLAGNLQAEDLLIEDSNASHYLTITTTSDLTATRTLTLVPGDADRTITLSGDLTVESASLVNQDLTTDASPQFTALNIGHATDTTLARSGAGDLTIEGNAIYRAGGTDVSLADGGTGASLSDPDDDQIMMWDDSAGAVVFMDIGTGLTINATPVLSVNATLDDIYTNGRSIVMDLDKITFDANDVSNDIFFFDIDIPTGGGTINPFLYDENIVYANGNTYTSVVHNIDVNLNLSGVTGPNTTTSTWSWIDMDLTYTAGGSGTNTLAFNLFDVDVSVGGPGGAILSGNFINFKVATTPQFSVSAVGNVYALGTLEIDGAAQFDGAATFNSTVSGISGRMVSRQILTQGTTTYTSPAGVTRIFVQMIGAGGGGGGADASAGNISIGGGGGGGSYAEKIFTVTASTGYTVAIGAGGAGGVGANGGSTGDNTTFTVGGTTVTCGGGVGGATLALGTSAVPVLGGNGGAVSTNGDLNSRGNAGGFGHRVSGTIAVTGFGASGYQGQGGGNSRATVGNGTAGTGYGAGGGGAWADSTVDRTGGAGSDGIIIVWEYSS